MEAYIFSPNKHTVLKKSIRQLNSRVVQFLNAVRIAGSSQLMGIIRSVGNTSSWETCAWDAHRGWCADVCGTRGSTPLSRDIEAVTRSLHVNHISVHANTHRLFTH